MGINPNSANYDQLVKKQIKQDRDQISFGMGMVLGPEEGLSNIISKGADEAAASANKIQNIVTNVKGWLGDKARMIKNAYDDTVIISEDGTRRVRFDINNPSPHENPHGHVEELINGKWEKSGPLYPTDVPNE